MSGQLGFIGRVPLAIVLASSALLGGCGEDCPDISGTWHLTAVCSGLDMPRAEEWEQDECRVVRRSVAGEELGSVTVSEDGGVSVAHQNTAAPCHGSIKGDVVEASCPQSVSQSCGPDTCCIMRWSR